MRTIEVNRVTGVAILTVSSGLTAVLLPVPRDEGVGRLTIRPARLTSGAGSYAPSVLAGLVTVTPAAIAAAAAPYSPRVVPAGSAILPPVLLPKSVFLAPSVTPGGVAVTPAALLSGGAVYAPIVQAPAAGAIQPAALGAAALLYPPVVQPAAVALQPALLASVVAAYAPVVQPAAVAIQTLLLASTAAFYAPIVQSVAAGLIQPAALASTVLTPTPVLVTGAVTVNAPATASGAMLYAPSFQPGAATLAPAALASAASFYAPSVLPGAAAIIPPMRASTASLYAPTLSAFDNSSLNPVIVFAGDSWVLPFVPFYTDTYANSRPDLTIVNQAQGGRKITDSQGNGLEQHEADVIAQRPYICHIGIGRNDLMLYASAQAWFDALVAHIGRMRLQLPGLRVSVETLTPRGDANPAAYNARRLDANALIRAARGGGAIDSIVDFAAEALLGAEANWIPTTPVTSDGLHLDGHPSQPNTGTAHAVTVFTNSMNALVAATPATAPGDQDVSSFSIALSPTSASETVTSRGGTISRTGALSRSAVAGWAIRAAGGSPVSPADFGGTYPSGDVVFAANETAKSFAFSVTNDSAIEPDETFEAYLTYGRTDGDLGAPASGMIVNDDTNAQPPVAYAVGPSAVGPVDLTNAKSFSNQSLSVGEALFYVYSAVESRRPQTMTLTPSSGTAVNAVLVQTNGEYTIWKATITAAGTYTIAFATAGDSMYVVAFVSIVISAATLPFASYQALAAASRATPSTAGAVQPVAANGLAVVFTAVNVAQGAAAPTVTSRPDGSTQRASVTVPENGYTGAINLAVATLPTSQAPAFGHAPSPATTSLMAASYAPA